MAAKYFCDICQKQLKDPLRVGWGTMYCLKCWKDKKNWSKIHTIKKSAFEP